MIRDDASRRGPGLAKTRGEPLVRVDTRTCVRVSDGRLRAMFELADVVSEGSARVESAVTVWFGTTSLVLPWPTTISPPERSFIAAMAALDPSVHLRAVRTAHREASLRAPGALGRAECEVKVSEADEGLRIDVDVQAPLTLPSHLGLLGRRPHR